MSAGTVCRESCGQGRWSRGGCALPGALQGRRQLRYHPWDSRDEAEAPLGAAARVRPGSRCHVRAEGETPALSSGQSSSALWVLPSDQPPENPWEGAGEPETCRHWGPAPRGQSKAEDGLKTQWTPGESTAGHQRRCLCQFLGARGTHSLTLGGLGQQRFGSLEAETKTSCSRGGPSASPAFVAPGVPWVVTASLPSLPLSSLAAPQRLCILSS